MTDSNTFVHPRSIIGNCMSTDVRVTVHCAIPTVHHRTSEKYYLKHYLMKCCMKISLMRGILKCFRVSLKLSAAGVGFQIRIIKSFA